MRSFVRTADTKDIDTQTSEVSFFLVTTKFRLHCGRQSNSLHTMNILATHAGGSEYAICLSVLRCYLSRHVSDTWIFHNQHSGHRIMDGRADDTPTINICYGQHTVDLLQVYRPQDYVVLTHKPFASLHYTRIYNIVASFTAMCTYINCPHTV